MRSPAALRNYKLQDTKPLLARNEPDANCNGGALERAASTRSTRQRYHQPLRDFVSRDEHTAETPLTLFEEAVALALVAPRSKASSRMMTLSDREVIVDKIQVQQVALDLIRNGIEVMASCPRREVAKVETYTVADNGPGSSADIRRPTVPALCYKQTPWHGCEAINLPDDHCVI